MFLPSKCLLWITYTSLVSIGLLAIILTELLEFFTYSWYKYYVGSTHCKYFIVPQFTAWLFTMFIDSFIFDWTNLAILSFLPLCVLSCFSCVQLLATPVADQAPLSMGFSRQEYWSRVPRPSPGDHPNPGIQLRSHISCLGRQVLYR